MSEHVSYEDYLEKHESLTYRNVGVSMLPLLRQGKDLFIVTRKTNERCQVGDVVLYRRPPQHYVLHRIVKVRPADYVILGDNCIRKEYGITDADIIGVMTGFVRGGKSYDVHDKRYRVYVFAWMHTISLRIFFKKCVLRLKRKTIRTVT